MTKSATVTRARKRADRLVSELRGTELEEGAANLAEGIRQSERLAKAEAKREALVTKAHAKREALATKARAKSEALAARAQDKGGELAAKAQAKGSKLAARAQDKGGELAAKAQAKGSKLAARAQDKGGELAARTQARSEALAERSLRRAGTRLSQGRAGDLLGIQPAKRGIPIWLVALLGIAAGYAIGVLTAPKRGAELRGELTDTARQATPLAEMIKSKLTSDPRTAQLPDLRVNVANGTVFVRGTVPPGFDQNALRDVIAKVPGVKDVDLQVSARA